MKISELMEKLKEILEKEGDLNVTSWPHDGQERLYDTTSADILENEDGKRVVNLDC